ncbi:MAG: tRNA (N6-threonylcarbamoyladenosine(37)-N6)-methyltransferase TrmO [Mogibacterium sp.]|nr:tRNA (N6-threonylcarbamoyladenosine(37)-N6)-methyltransferase TrmO [Mogibacterium sp.]
MENDRFVLRPIAYVRSDYNQKFGIPRQANLVTELEQAIVIEPEFRNMDALRGLTGFDYLWLIWGFSKTALDMEAETVNWKPTVRPPRLGGEERMGVWATRSPYRPNSLGLSNVRVRRIELDGLTVDPYERRGMVSGELAIIVSGADLLNGTPVYDIKPYMPYSDSHPDARAGFTEHSRDVLLEVEFPEHMLELIDEDKRAGLIQTLRLDPRDAYNKKSAHTYGLSFADYDIKFEVTGDTLTVTAVTVN